MDEIKNAVVKSIDIRVEEHGCLICNVTLDGGDWLCCFGGGYNLCSSDKFNGGDCTGFFIRRLLKVFFKNGEGSLNDIIEKPCRVKFEGNKAEAIGHFLTDIWFEPRKELKD